MTALLWASPSPSPHASPELLGLLDFLAVLALTLA